MLNRGFFCYLIGYGGIDLLTTKPRGTNDFLPGEVERWQQLEEEIRSLFNIYQYQEIRTPIFEHTELFLRSVGETSDIVEKEMYSFEDKGMRYITLRPEGTAGVVRAFLENGLFANALPQKLYYIGPMFRYDQPQSGRYRQFHQFGCEVLGSLEPSVDAEVISYAMMLFQKLGLKDLSVSINTVGCPECRPNYEKALKEYFHQYIDQLCPTCQARLEKNPLRILDCKDETCKKIALSAPTTLDYACESCRIHFNTVQSFLNEVNVQYHIDTSLVRGLDYYTQTAFEISMKNSSGQQNAICGGGRYNRLVAECGGDDIPGMGFAAGIERLLLSLKEEGIVLGDKCKPHVYFAPLDKESTVISFKFLQALREKGLPCEMDLMNKSLKSQMKTANRLMVNYVVMIGGDEREGKYATVRNLMTSEQEQIKFEDLTKSLVERISNASLKKNV